MSNTGIKRILVALDASETNRSALQAATSLASQLQADLQALFIEDINLLRLAELPFAREMVFGRRERQRITPANMERQIQEQATRLRQLVEAAALQNQIKVDFKVLRGQISAELRLAAQQMDLLILGKGSQLVQQGLKLGNFAQAVLASVNCNVLLLQYGATIEQPVAIFYDGTAASQRALQVAIQLARGDHDQLKVIYPATDPDQYHALQQQVDALTRPLGFEPGQLQLSSNTAAALLYAVDKSRGRVLVIEVSNDLLKTDSIATLLQQSRIPLVVIR